MAGPRHPRKSSDESKRQIAEMCNAGKPPWEIMEEYGLGRSALRRWTNSVNAAGSPRAADNRTPGQRRTIGPERENGQLGMESDISKQAALISARRRGSSRRTPAATPHQRSAGYSARPARPTTPCAAGRTRFRPPTPCRGRPARRTATAAAGTARAR